MSKRGILIILSGPSGVGKGTVRKEVFKHDELSLAYSISMTTREPRVGEIEGSDYFFVSKEQFENNIKEGKLLEWAQFVGNYYGTPKEYVDKLLDEGKNVMLEIEVKGAEQVMEKCPEALTIFIVPPSFEELERRIRGRRSEEEEVVQQRLSKARGEMELTSKYKYVVVNNEVLQTTDEIVKIISDNLEK